MRVLCPRQGGVRRHRYGLGLKSLPGDPVRATADHEVSGRVHDRRRLAERHEHLITDDVPKVISAEGTVEGDGEGRKNHAAQYDRS